MRCDLSIIVTTKGKVVMEKSLKNMIEAIEYNIEGYKIRKEYRAAEAAAEVVAELKKRLGAL